MAGGSVGSGDGVGLGVGIGARVEVGVGAADATEAPSDGGAVGAAIVIEAQETVVDRTSTDSAAITPRSRRRARLIVTTRHGTPAGDRLSGPSDPSRSSLPEDRASFATLRRG